jgi:hypothetical protein
MDEQPITQKAAREMRAALQAIEKFPRSAENCDFTFSEAVAEMSAMARDALVKTGG